MQLTEEIVFGLLQSDQDFPIDFDDAWKWIEYTQKKTALSKLRNNFDKGSDYLGDDSDEDDMDFALPNGKAKRGGQNRNIIFLTVDCFKNFCMMAGTPRGREVRRYFLNCEKELKRRLEEERSQFKQDKQQVLIEAMVSKDVVSRKPKFDDEFYAMVYRLYGKGLKDRDPKSSQRPPYLAILTNNAVYNRMLGGVAPGGVKDTLDQVNPRRENGTRKNKHHSHLKELGRFHLETHLYTLKVMATLFPDGRWDLFMEAVTRAFPNDEPLQLTLWSVYEQIQMESQCDVVIHSSPYSQDI